MLGQKDSNMAKARSLEEKLAHLRSLRGAPHSPQVLQDLRNALVDRSNLAVAEAASIAGEGHLTDLGTDLVEAFDRLMSEPAKSDKLCRAKIAIAEALNQIEF